jgi:MYXO-CTERM domain-containing protein
MTRIAALALIGALASTTAHAQARRLAGWGDPDPTVAGELLFESKHPAISADGFTTFEASGSVTLDAVLYDDDGAIGIPVLLGDSVDGGTIDAIGDLLAMGGSSLVFEAGAGTRQLIVGWDAANDLRRVFDFADTLPFGADGFNVEVVQANARGDVLLAVEGTEIALARADGTIAPLLAVGVQVPGATAYVITGVGNAFLSDDGRVTALVASLGPNGTETFILQGQAGALQLLASSADLPGDTFRELQLLGAAPSGKVVYGSISQSQNGDDDHYELRQGSPGATEVSYSATGYDPWMKIDGAYSLAPLQNTSRALYADNDELALETSVQTDVGMFAAIVVWHDGAWSTIASMDSPMGDGSVPSLAGNNERGQVALSLGGGVYRYSPGNGVELIARMGNSFDVGLDTPQPCAAAGVGSFDALALPVMDREGNVVFEVGWAAPDGNMATTAMTTRPLGKIDLSLDELKAVANDSLVADRNVTFTAKVHNRGSSPTDAKLVIATDTDAFVHDDACTSPLPGRIVCPMNQTIAPGATVSYGINLLVKAATHGELTGTVTVMPLSENDDDDPSNDSKSFELDLDPDDVGKKGCRVAPSTADGSFWLLALLGLGGVRRRKSHGTRATQQNVAHA